METKQVPKKNDHLIDDDAQVHLTQAFLLHLNEEDIEEIKNIIFAKEIEKYRGLKLTIVE